MAALTAASWTVTILTRSIKGGKRQITGTLLLAGADTYPDNGIPLPTIDKLGFKRQLDSLLIFGVDPTAGTVSDYVYRWDKTNHKLFLYEEEATAAGGPLLECDTAEVPGPRTLNFAAEGW
jgi:hypothetical protein